MQEMLQEYVDLRGVAIRVDRQAGVIRGVKILGFQSRNGRTYRPEALAQAAPLYEGAKVNVNHPKGHPLSPRDYQDRIGQIRGVELRPGEGLFGDFHFNPKHALAEQLAWDAEHAPENVGFSHNVEARTSRSGDQVIVEAILRVQSVDLVADPATTRGLFEATQPAPESAPQDPRPPCPALFHQMTLEALKEHRPDLVEAIGREAAADRSELRAELARYEAAEALRQRRVRVCRWLREQGLPDPDRAEGASRLLVSDRFVQALLEVPDDETVRRLVEERAALARSLGPPGWRDSGRPQARHQLELDAAPLPDAKAFAEAIT